MPKVIISYRRSDSDAIAGRIRDRLVSDYGRNSVFMAEHGLDVTAFDFSPTALAKARAEGAKKTPDPAKLSKWENSP